MEIKFNNTELANTNSLFDKEYFENMDLTEDMEHIYSLVKNEEEYEEYEKEMNLSKMRVDNHKKYYNIKIKYFENLPNKYYLDVKKIKKIYNEINEKRILKNNYKDSEETKYKLIQLEKLIDEFKTKLEKDYKIISKENDNVQKLWNYKFIKRVNVSKEEKTKLLNYYNELIIVSSNFKNNVFEDIKVEFKRREYIDKINQIIKEEEKNLVDKQKQKELDLLNKKIQKPKQELNDKVKYLEMLIIDNSKYKDDFKKFKKLCNAIKNYDKNNIDEARYTYKLLCLQNKIDIFVNRLEKLFLEELEKQIKGNEYKEYEINLMKLSNVTKEIEKNYYDTLNKIDSKYIRELKRKLNDKIINIGEEKQKLNLLIKKLWKVYLTDVYAYNSDKDYHFICSNNQFIEPKYETILLTRDIVKKTDNYGEYQIGFICNNIDNIMYTTEKHDIMDVENNELEFLKLPSQVEKSFVDFNNYNRILLDGNKTVLEAVYFIDDGDINKLYKAIELANTYNIPLIKLKRDNK